MKLVAHEISKVTWLFPFEEFLPLEGIKDPAFLASLVARYSFAQVPNTAVTVEEFRRDGFRFAAGFFGLDACSGPINEVWVYNDGLVAAASTTDIGHSFLIDLTTWLRAEWAFRETTSIRELFLSSLVVEFERPLSRLLVAHEAISRAVSSKPGQLFRTPDTMGLARIDFEFDRTSDTLKLPAPRFILERRPNVPYDQERYFASAPMSTSDHLEALAAIEDLIASA